MGARIAKRATPAPLRHSFATQFQEAAYNRRFVAVSAFEEDGITRRMRITGSDGP
jgi:hypothetical protein